MSKGILGTIKQKIRLGFNPKLIVLIKSEHICSILFKYVVEHVAILNNFSQ